MPISTSQRYASVKSMMRFSMYRLLAFQRRLQELRYQNETTADSDFIAGLEAFEDRGPAVGGFTGSYRAHGEPVGRHPHEHYVLTIDLLDGIGGDQYRRLDGADWEFRVGQHFRPQAVTSVVQLDANLHHADFRIELLEKIGNRAGEASAFLGGQRHRGGLPHAQLSKILLTHGSQHPYFRKIANDKRDRGELDGLAGGDILLDNVAVSGSDDGHVVFGFVAPVGGRIGGHLEVVFEEVASAIYFDLHLTDQGLGVHQILLGLFHCLEGAGLQIQEPLRAVAIALKLRSGGLGALQFG